MLNQVKIPSRLSLNGNEMVAIYKTDGHILNVGKKAELTLDFGAVGHFGNMQVGQWIKFAWNSEIVVLTCAVVPDQSGLQFPKRLSSESVAAWVEKLYGVMKVNFKLSRDFYISMPTMTKIYLVAKEKGSGFTLTGTWNLSPAHIFTSVAGAGETYRDFFNVDLEIQQLVNGVWTTLGHEYLTVDEGGVAISDVHAYLNRIYPGFVFPENNQTIFKKTSNTINYRLRACENWMDGDETVYTQVKESPTLTAMCGGLDTMLLTKLQGANMDWFANLMATKQFLTWAPRVKKVRVDQMEKLFFYLKDNQVEIKVKVRRWMSPVVGGAQISDILTKTYANCEGDKVYEVIVTGMKLGLLLNMTTGYQLDKWEVWLENSAGQVLSETRTYEVDQNYYLQERYLLFRNSLGGYDTLRCTGEKVTGATLERVEVLNTANFYSSLNYPEFKFNQILERGKYSINTGWLTSEEAEWLRELFLSKEVYIIDNGQLTVDNGGASPFDSAQGPMLGDLVLIPIVIGNSEIAIRKDNVWNYNYEISYMNAFSDEYHSGRTVVTQQLSNALTSSVGAIMQGS